MTRDRQFGILVAIDDSPASGRAIQYVAQVVGARERFHLHLLHVLPPLPPRALEHPGAEHPEDQARFERELVAKQQAIVETNLREAEQMFERVRFVLTEAGFEADAIGTESRPATHGQSIARQCLDSADEHHCSTIALGRESLPWHQELFHSHVAEDLVRHGERHTIWVIE